MKSLNQVIVALDYENPDLAYTLVEQLGEKITTYKVGPMLFTRSGTEVVRFLHKKNKKVFVDLKLLDTPDVVSNTIRQLAEMGVSYASVHCLGGRKMLEAAGHACRHSSLKLIGVTLLTSFDDEAAKSWGWTLSTGESVMRLIDLAMAMRLAGIICSPHEIREARAKMLEGGLIITPGIRLPGKEVYKDDQVRFASPSEALDWGADYIVVGRPITQAADPVGTVENLFK
jgi:orotidine-5'-phosphate decarboxylase